MAKLRASCSKVPEWLLFAETQNAEVSIDVNGKVVWHSGIWKGGTWHKGTWVDGTWKNGNWYGGG